MILCYAFLQQPISSYADFIIESARISETLQKDFFQTAIRVKWTDTQAKFAWRRWASSWVRTHDFLVMRRLVWPMCSCRQSLMCDDHFFRPLFSKATFGAAQSSRRRRQTQDGRRSSGRTRRWRRRKSRRRSTRPVSSSYPPRWRRQCRQPTSRWTWFTAAGRRTQSSRLSNAKFVTR